MFVYKDRLVDNYELNYREIPFCFVVLLDTFGQTNFSLWYVELLGCSEPSLVRAAARRLKEVYIHWFIH